MITEKLYIPIFKYFIFNLSQYMRHKIDRKCTQISKTPRGVLKVISIDHHP